MTSRVSRDIRAEEVTLNPEDIHPRHIGETRCRAARRRARRDAYDTPLAFVIWRTPLVVGTHYINYVIQLSTHFCARHTASHTTCIPICVFTPSSSGRTRHRVIAMTRVISRMFTYVCVYIYMYIYIERKRSKIARVIHFLFYITYIARPNRIAPSVFLFI